jgi:glycerate 2-kinase
MAGVWLQHAPVPNRGLVIGTRRGAAQLGSFVWREGGHPIPDERSVAAGREAIAFAQSVTAAESLVVLLSGGASAVMAMPLGKLTIADKQTTVSVLLKAGADITALNTVRKHLSAIKGGRLAAACQGATMTLAISDVVGDDPGVIGSGPTVPDATTFADARQVIEELGVARRLSAPVVSFIEAGVHGKAAESIKPGDRRLARSEWWMIGGRRDAMLGAKEAAEGLGYHTVTVEEPIVGEARVAGSRYVRDVRLVGKRLPSPACIISSGETTVTIAGDGVGGRNQEFVLAATVPLADCPQGSTIASVGTDGIDGPTDAAGAIADTSTLSRAAVAGLDPAEYLTRNDSYRFFASLNDLIVTGPTDTNVGDVQIALIP